MTIIAVSRVVDILLWIADFLLLSGAIVRTFRRQARFYDPIRFVFAALALMITIYHVRGLFMADNEGMLLGLNVFSVIVAMALPWVLRTYQGDGPKDGGDV